VLWLDSVRTQEEAFSSDSRFRRKLRGTTGHRLLGTQRPQVVCVAAWVWFCLSTELMATLPLIGIGQRRQGRWRVCGGGVLRLD